MLTEYHRRYSQHLVTDKHAGLSIIGFIANIL